MKVSPLSSQCEGKTYPLTMRFGRSVIVALLLAAISATQCHRESDGTQPTGASTAPLSGLPSSAGPAERVLFTKSPSCYSCAQSHCAERIARCEQIEGTAASGPAQGKLRKDLCLSTLDCVFNAGCANRDNSLKCLCGTTNGLSCISPAANGPCKAALEAGLETTEPKDMATDWIKETTGGGSAMALVHCLIDNRCRG
ncbi:MAG TPA: hypothetical protein VIV60_36695, partial [Polyangiaceae bacterium]